MPLSNTTEIADIRASVKELSHRGDIPETKAFAAWIAINLFDVDEDEALEAAALDGGNDQGIDLIFASEASQEIICLQAHYPQTEAKKTPKNKWDAVVASVPFVRKPSLLADEGRKDLAQSVKEIVDGYPDYSYAFGLVSFSANSPEVQANVRAHNNANEGVSYFYFCADDILEKYAAISLNQGVDEDTLTFANGFIDDKGDYGRSYIGSVSAKELQRLHKAHNDLLFAGNVRLFLGNRRGGINEQIVKSAQESPGTFWALNNGITLVADTASPSAADPKKTLVLKKFSIVNGCQTTNCLVQAGATKAKVLARVIAAKSNLKTDIVRFNNSQNAVRIWTVRAVDQIQEQLRSEFSKVGIEYAPKQQGARRRKSRDIIELDKVAQFLAASTSEFLIAAIDNKTELFDQPYQKLFPKTVKAREVYLAWLTGNLADEERLRRLEVAKQDDDLVEMIGLLAVTSTYWIVFCAYEMMRGHTKDIKSPHLALERMKTPEFSNALKKYVSSAAELYWNTAVDTYDPDEYGSSKSALRSTKFLQRFGAKSRLKLKTSSRVKLPDLVAVCRGK